MPRLAPAASLSALFTGVLPTPRIRSIKLSYSPFPPKVSNPHIDHDREAIVYKDRAGKRKIGHTGFNLQKDPRNLLVDLTVVLVDTIQDNGDSLWFKDQDLMKYLRLQVVHSEDEKFTKALKEKTIAPMPSEINRTKANNGRVISKVLSLDNEQNLSNYYERQIGEDTYKEITYKFSFAVDTTTPKHLTYFANVFLDVDQMINDYSLDLPNSAKITALSATAVESVYRNGKKVTSASAIYSKKTGTLSAEPVYSIGQNLYVPLRVLNDAQISRDLASIYASISSDTRPTVANKYASQIRTIITDDSSPKYLQVKNILKSWSKRGPQTKAGQIYLLLKAKEEKYTALATASNKYIKKSISNPTILDNRLEKVNLSLDLGLNSMEDKVKIAGIRSDSSNIVLKTVAKNLKNAQYFSDLSVTRSPDGSTRGYFFLNWEQMVKKNSIFAGLIENSTESIVDELRKQVQLGELRLIRERVDDKYILQRQGSHMTKDRGSISQVIATAALDKSGHLRGERLQDSYNSKKGILLGTLMEAHYDGITNRDLRAFEFVDADIATRATGYYKYRIEISLVDSIGSYLYKKLKELNKATEGLRKYYNISQMPCNYDVVNEKYTEFFLAALYEKYSLPAPASTGRLSAEQVAGLLAEESPAQAPWIKPVAKYIEVLNLFSNLTDPAASSASRRMYTKIEPSTGTPDGVLETIKEFEDLGTKITKILNLATQNDPSAVNRRSKISANRNRAINLDYMFGEKIDNKALRNVNARFLEYASQNKYGLPVITSTDYSTRLKQEEERYFKNQPKASSTAISDMGTYRYSYLSPSHLQVGGKVLSLLNRGEALYDADQYREMLFSISLLKSNPAARSLTMPVLDWAPTGMEQKQSFATKGAQLNAQAMTLLSNFGISFGAPSPPKHLSNTKPTGPLLGVRELLGENTLLSIINASITDSDDTIESEDLLSKLNSEVNMADASLFASSLIATLANVGMTNFLATADSSKQISSTSAASIEQAQFSKTIDFFDLSNPKNGLDSSMRSKNTKLSDSDSKIRQIPNQIKTLFLTKAQTVSPAKNWFEAGTTDPISDPALRPLFEILYFNIQRIEVLKGFRTTNSGQIMLRSPIYKLLTKEEFSASGRQVCRLTRYRNDSLQIGQNDLMDLPVMNKHFVLKLSSKSQAPEATANTPAYKLSNLQLDFASNYEKSITQALISTHYELATVESDYCYTEEMIYTDESQFQSAVTPVEGMPPLISNLGNDY